VGLLKEFVGHIVATVFGEYQIEVGGADKSGGEGIVVLLNVFYQVGHRLGFVGFVKEIGLQRHNIGGLGINRADFARLWGIGSGSGSAEHHEGNIGGHGNPLFVNKFLVKGLFNVLVKLGVVCLVVGVSQPFGHLLHNPGIVGVVGAVGNGAVGGLNGQVVAQRTGGLQVVVRNPL